MNSNKKHYGATLLMGGIAAAVIISIALWFTTGYGSGNLLTLGLPKTIPQSQSSKDVTLRNGETYDMTASFVNNTINGESLTMLAYNKSIPGPVLRVTQGDKIKIKFKNEVNIDTTVHAHGLRQDVKMDGMVGMSQKAIQTGDGFTYEWSFPDPGVYWYHPHVREDYQQGSGMYGAIVVAPKDTAYWPSADSDHVLMLSDVLIDAKTGSLAPFSSEQADHTMMGRYGNIQLLNGTTNWKATAKVNTVQRYYIANASNARPYRFAIDGVKMKVIGSDNGRVGDERFVDALTLSPGERYVVDVMFTKVGAVAIKNIAPNAAATLGEVTVVPNEAVSSASTGFTTLRSNKDVIDAISRLAGEVTATKRLGISMDMGGSMAGMDHGSMSSNGSMMMPDGSMMDASGATVPAEFAGIEWTDTGMSTDSSASWQLIDQDTSRSNEAVKWTFKKGDVVRVKIENSLSGMHPMQHPIHIHGQRFALVSMNGTSNPNPDWKDTITIPSGETYELLVKMDNPGEWMLHCHIAEHLESGMAITFKVEK